MGKTMSAKIIARVGFNVVVAGLLYSMLTGFLEKFQANSVLMTTIVSLAVLLWIVPTILEKRPGQETFLSFILAIPAGVAVINLLESLFKVTIPILQVSNVSLFSMSFFLVLVSYFAADWAFISLFKN